ncbi:Ig-like domain-containing protein [Alishewanella longhuensis]
MDLFDKLETAAGNSAGGSSGGGNSFVRLTRIQDQVDSQETVYLTPNLVDAEPPMATSENIVRAASPIEPELLVNQSPTSTDLSLSTNEDQPISNQILANDIDGDSLAYVLSTAPSNGALVLNPDTGTFTYTPNANYNGSDSFVVTISDGQAAAPPVPSRLMLPR